MTKPIQVVSAIIIHPTLKLILLAQRCDGDAFPLKWETPGGKIEGDELGCDALRRELIEELDWPTSSEAQIANEPFMTFSLNPECDHVRVPIDMSFFIAIASDTWVPQLLEAMGCGWFSIYGAGQLDMTPGTRRAIERLKISGLPPT